MTTSPTVAVVTGAGRGMGRSCADALARTVDTLALVDRDPDLLATACDQLGATGATVTTRSIVHTNTAESQFTCVVIW